MRRAIAFAILLAAGCHDHAAPALELGKTPAPFGPFAGLRPGMTTQDAIAAVPSLKHEVKADGTGSIAWFGDAKGAGRVSLAHGHAEVISIVTPAITPAQIVTAWGPGELEPDAHPTYETRRYLDPATHVRTDLTSGAGIPTELVWLEYVPAAQLLDATPGTFDGVPAIGRPVDEVIAALGKRGIGMEDPPGDLRFARVPATEYGRAPTVTLAIVNGVVREVDCSFPLDRGEARAPLVVLASHKPGAKIVGNDPHAFELHIVAPDAPN